MWILLIRGRLEDEMLKMCKKMYDCLKIKRIIREVKPSDTLCILWISGILMKCGRCGRGY